MTQLEAARAGEITPEMEFVAKRESLPVETIREEVDIGRMVMYKVMCDLLWTPTPRNVRVAGANSPPHRYLVDYREMGGLCFTLCSH